MNLRVLLFLSLLLPATTALAQSEREEALLNEAYTAYNNQQYADSTEKLEQALEISPENPTANYFLGICLYQLEKPDEAIPPLEAAVAVPNPPEGAEAFLASLYVATDQSHKALPYYEEQYEKDPANEEMAYQYASILKANEDYPEALAVYRTLLEGESQYADAARYDMGAIYTSYESYGQAIKMFHRIPVGSPYGDAASDYIKNLQPSVDYFSVYASQEYFYNSNPGSAGTTLTDGTSNPSLQGSHGGTLVASISSRNIELSHKLKLSLNFLHYSISYHEAFATEYDFNGNYINPYIHYIFNPTTSLHWENAFEYMHYNNQFFNNNYRSRLVFRRAKGRNSLQVLCGIENSQYTDSYKNTTSSTPISMEYKNGNTLEIGAGGSMYFPKYGVNLRMNYSYNALLPDSPDDPALQAKVNDSEYRDHIASGSLTIPLPGWFSRCSLIGNASYSYKNYINTQSGQVYPSAAGESINMRTLSYGAKVRILLLKTLNLNMELGVDSRTVDSQAQEAEYEVDRRFVQISASF